MRQYYTENNKAVPSMMAIKQVIRMLIALAGEKEQKELRLRVAPGENDAILYDLGDEAWQAVKVTPEGWEIIANPPILFRRFTTNGSQVIPERRGNPLARLLEFVNIQDENEKLLFKIYLITCFIPDIPHPAAVFYGHQGAAKTTVARLIKRLVDPGSEVTAFPGTTKELAQLLSHNYVSVFDNLTHISPAQSNMLCQAVTGGGLMKRRLYTDEDDVELLFKGCVIMNGISLVAEKPDLLDRSLLFELNKVANVRDEKEFWQDFEKERPFILGGIFDTLAAASRLYPDLQTTKAPRLADFFRWGVAVCKAMGGDQDVFVRAYEDNRRKMHGEVITGEPLAEAIMDFMQGREQKGPFEGKASVLLGELRAGGARCIPKQPNLLSRRLKEISVNLNAANIEVDFRKNTTENTTVIKITKIITGTTEAA